MSNKARQSLFALQKALEQKIKPPVSTFSPALVTSESAKSEKEIKPAYSPLPLYKPERYNSPTG